MPLFDGFQINLVEFYLYITCHQRPPDYLIYASIMAITFHTKVQSLNQQGASLLCPVRSPDVPGRLRLHSNFKVCISRSEEHTSELQSLRHLVCRLLLEKKTNT